MVRSWHWQQPRAGLDFAFVWVLGASWDLFVQERAYVLVEGYIFSLRSGKPDLNVVEMQCLLRTM